MFEIKIVRVKGTTVFAKVSKSGKQPLEVTVPNCPVHSLAETKAALIAHVEANYWFKSEALKPAETKPAETKPAETKSE